MADAASEEHVDAAGQLEPSPTPTTHRATRAATTAALFLQPFAGDLPWAHLDVAGPARAGSDDADIVKGGTGFGTRTLLRWLEAGAPVGAMPVVEEL